MKAFTAITATLACATTAFASTIAKRATTAVTIKGNAFFSGSDRFYIRGVDYQPGGSSKLVDPIADPTICLRDIKKFQELGINTIRVYSVDNSVSHDTCMKALADAGIYLILDVNSPLYSINRQDPIPSYNDVYLQSVFATIDAFQKYDNTLAFFSGNEVINETTASTITAPYVKAVTRDMKQYIANRGYRGIPVGYSAADVSTNREETAAYLNCGTADERSDFFAFNDYSWCSPSSFTTSGWSQKVQNFSSYSIPIFLSEYGCNKGKRTFEEIAALYSDKMTPVYSGGLVYEYSQEDNKFGLVSLSGGSVNVLPDYTALKTALSKTPSPSGSGNYKTSGTPSKCPSGSKTWLPKDDALPLIPEGAVKFMTAGAGKGPGLKGNSGFGSQNAGTPSTGTATAGSGTPSQSAGSAPAATSSGAASSVRVPGMSVAPFVIAAITASMSVFGVFLL